MIDLFLTNLDRFLVITGRLLANILNLTGLLLDCLYALYLGEKNELIFDHSLIAGPAPCCINVNCIHVLVSTELVTANHGV